MSMKYTSFAASLKTVDWLGAILHVLNEEGSDRTQRLRLCEKVQCSIENLMFNQERDVVILAE